MRCKYIGFRKSEFVGKVQFLCLQLCSDVWNWKVRSLQNLWLFDPHEFLVSATSGCKDIRVSKSEFEAYYQFLFSPGSAKVLKLFFVFVCKTPERS